MLLLIDCKYQIIHNQKNLSHNISNGMSHANVQIETELVESLIPNPPANGQIMQHKSRASHVQYIILLVIVIILIFVYIFAFINDFSVSESSS